MWVIVRPGRKGISPEVKYGDNVSFEHNAWSEIKSGFTHFQDNDVVIAKITPCFQNRKSVVIKNLMNGIGAGTTELHVFRGNDNYTLPEYVLIFFKTPCFIEEGITKMTGTAGQQRVPKEYVALKPFPFPPLNEQKRIVEKVDDLMNLCDTLEEQLTTSKKESERLMEAVLQEAFAGRK